MEFGFEKLEVWQLSRKLASKIYLLTKSFSEDERFGLTSQLRRAVISIASNIAEGSVRYSNVERKRFYEIAYGSSIEVMNQLIISNDLGYINKESLDILRNEITIINKMISALTKSLK